MEGEATAAEIGQLFEDAGDILQADDAAHFQMDSPLVSVNCHVVKALRSEVLTLLLFALRAGTLHAPSMAS